MNREAIKEIILNKGTVNYGKLTICDIRLWSNYKGNRYYQVYCETKDRFADNYVDLDEAIDKFLELKKLIKPYVY